MIIICECKSYQFDIPNSELPKKNTLVQCSLCGKEWYQDFTNNKIISDKKQINPSKIKNLNITNTNKPKSLINYIFVFVIFILSIYGIMIMFEKEILEYQHLISQEDQDIVPFIQKNLEAGVYHAGPLSHHWENGLIHFHSLIRSSIS